MSKALFDEVELRDRRVLLRTDFNVPMDADRIVDDRRIAAAIPTIKKLVSAGARTVVVSHRGRPKGKVDEALRLAPVARHLGELLQLPVEAATDVVGESAQDAVAGLGNGGVVMLENVRFEAGEEANDPAFARQLADFADIFVNDAFGTAHRAHASTEGITHYLPAYAGYLMAKEIASLSAVLSQPQRPLVAVIGGAKISSKLAVLRNLLQQVDELWVGGAMASTLIRASGGKTGRSLVEDDQLAAASELLDLSGAGGKLRLPTDVIAVAEPRAGAETHIVPAAEVPADLMAVDIGPATVAAMAQSFQNARTVVWNGPLGLYEIPDFAQGTRAAGMALAACPAFSVAGGGDLVAALDAAGIAAKLGFVSTGGGATLEFLEGKTLPGVAALRDHVAVP